MSDDETIERLIRTLAKILLTHEVAKFQDREGPISYTGKGRAVLEEVAQMSRLDLIRDNEIFVDLPPVEVTYDAERRPEINFKVVS
jgi:hypothetical protein